MEPTLTPEAYGKRARAWLLANRGLLLNPREGEFLGTDLARYVRTGRWLK